MVSTVKEVLYGTLQEAILTAKEGHEVASVEVFNKTTGEPVPSELKKLSDNPPKWSCAFRQPAGIVVVRPKLRPLYYQVIIEECENCSIVLVEASDAENIKVALVESDAVADILEDHGAAAPSDNGSCAEVTNETETAPAPDAGAEEVSSAPDSKPAAEGPQEPAASQDGGADEGATESPRSGENPAVGAEEAEDGKASGTGEGSDAANEEEVIFSPEFDAGEDADEGESTAEDTSDGEEPEEDETANDSAYDAGEFEGELQEVEPTYITQAAYDEKCNIFWKHRRALDSGEISKADFEKVKKKHMAFMDDVTTGRIIVE